MKRNRLEVLLHELGEDIARIDTKDSSEIDEFDHIDAPFTALNPRNCRLRGLQSSGDFDLREFGGFSSRQESRAQRPMTARSKSLQRGCSH
jgi:hypothetical protein